MEETGASFVFTGEVLGERPMSQNLRAMQIIERESGLEGRLLRPLSAKFFEPTIPEKEGIVNRDRLLAISGRSRKPQIALAKEKNIFDYPCAAGGCRLTDPNFARRLKDAFAHKEDSITEIILLRYGRHFRLPGGAKVIIGRNEQENRILKAYTNSNHNILMEAKDFVGPIALLSKYKDQKDIELAAGLCLFYSDYKGNDPGKVKIQDSCEITVQPIPEEKVKGFRI